MAAEIEKLAAQFAKQYPEVATLLRVNAIVARRLGAPESFRDVPDIPPNHKLTEKVVGIKRFTDEQREALEKRGYTVYPLSGQSIRSLREAGREFLSSCWQQRYPDFENQTSRLSEVAINPGKLFLEASDDKTLKQQEILVEEFSKRLKGRLRIEGVKAIMGEAPDYAELAFRYIDVTGKSLFSEETNTDGYIRTKTVVDVVDPNVTAIVGSFSVGNCLSVYDGSSDKNCSFVWAAPLVVPA